MRRVLAMFDKDGNGGISPADFKAFVQDPGSYDPELEGPLSEFLQIVAAEMKLGSQSAAVFQDGSVRFVSDSISTAVFTPAGLCHLVQLSVADQKVADALCNILAQAEDAHSKGNSRRRDRLMEDFKTKVIEEINRSVTRKNALTIITMTDVTIVQFQHSSSGGR